jgi:hypothetical protein
LLLIRRNWPAKREGEDQEPKSYDVSIRPVRTIYSILLSTLGDREVDPKVWTLNVVQGTLKSPQKSGESHQVICMKQLWRTEDQHRLLSSLELAPFSRIRSRSQGKRVIKIRGEQIDWEIIPMTRILRKKDTISSKRSLQMQIIRGGDPLIEVKLQSIFDLTVLLIGVDPLI